jgi:polysaccharide export outer membrane protein
MWNVRVLSALILFLLASAVVGQTTAAKPEPVSTPPDDLVAGVNSKNERYRIGFQDILDINVFRHPELAQRVPVSPNGTIVLFRLERPVVAVCKTERELATEIENAYKEKYLKDPKVQVAVADQRSQSVMVIGAVEKPGTYFINRRYHLLELLALAGGPNKESGTRMLVARTGSSTTCREKGDETDGDQISVMGFKVRDVQEGRQTLWMQPGDVISVLDADMIYVYGNVNKQGSVKVREPITLTQAIVSAEGFKSAAKTDKVRVLRQVQGNADREELIFDMNEIDKGKIKDPYLEPNDIVAVSQDTKKKILLGIADAIKTSVPSALYRLP